MTMLFYCRSFLFRTVEDFEVFVVVFVLLDALCFPGFGTIGVEDLADRGLAYVLVYCRSFRAEVDVEEAFIAFSAASRGEI